MIPVPPATKSNKRIISAEIRTEMLHPAKGGKNGGTTAAGWVVATYECTRRYRSPIDAPVFARMMYERPRAGVDMPPGGVWTGHILLQTFSDREQNALRDLLDTLRMTGLDRTMPPTEWARLESITHDLAHTTISTPWEQQPMPRARKARRKRLRWTDPTRPKGAPRVNVYVDTLQRSAAAPPRHQEDPHAEEVTADPIPAAPPTDPVHRPGNE